MNFQELMQRMVELDQPVSEEKKADKDYDGDGEVESGKDEYMGSRMKAAEKDVDESLVDECGSMMPSTMSPMSPKQQDSVNMSVNLNAAGSNGIKDLMAILKGIEEQDNDAGNFGDADADVIIKKMAGPGMDMIDDDYANQPDEVYQGVDAVTQTGGDLHSKGIEAPAANGGGNPMSLKARLESLYHEVKSR